MDGPAGSVAWGVEVEQVLLAAPRGFCAGVEMAIKALAWMVRVFEPPVYCYHEIVHNQVVVDRFRQLGGHICRRRSPCAAGRPVMLSAHGSAPEVVAAARANGGAVVNAVCPLVTKVHHEVKLRASKGYTDHLCRPRRPRRGGGHDGGGARGHPPGRKRGRGARLPEPEGPVAFLAQTTLALDEWRNILEAAQQRWPDLWVPGRSRPVLRHHQPPGRPPGRSPAAATPWSSSAAPIPPTPWLWSVRPWPPVAPGCSRVNRADELPDDLAGMVGVIAGASAPESLVEEVLERLAPARGTEEVRAVPEDDYFPLPRELREVLRTVAGRWQWPPLPPGRRPRGSRPPSRPWTAGT